MLKKIKLTLFQRIFALLIIGISVSSWFITITSEDVIEASINEQIRKQGLIYLFDAVDHLHLYLPDHQPEAMNAFLIAHSQLPDYFDFSIYRLFIFNLSGEVIASSDPKQTPSEEINTTLLKMLEDGKPYISQEVIYEQDTQGKTLPVTDIILPYTEDGKLVGGIELEINLQETLQMVKQLDNRHEMTVIKVISITTVILLFFLGVVIHRNFIRPITHFQHITAEIANENLTVRSDITSKDELGELSHSINHMADNIEQLLKQQQDAYLQVLQTLAKVLEARDPYTATHSSRVTRYAVKLAKHLNLPQEDHQVLKQGALMHDLGKIGIPDAILNKPGVLTEQEMAVMRTHPEKTAKILQPLKHLKQHAAIAAWHHERWDGKGYPDGLAGDQILLLAQIVSIADTWDAMTGDRIYRKGLSFEKALDILEKEINDGQFNPELLQAFIKMIRGGMASNTDLP